MLSIAFALIVLAGYVFMFALCGICGEQSRREEAEDLRIARLIRFKRNSE